jgi:hypothetical protein
MCKVIVRHVHFVISDFDYIVYSIMIFKRIKNNSKSI